MVSVSCAFNHNQQRTTAAAYKSLQQSVKVIGSRIVVATKGEKSTHTTKQNRVVILQFSVSNKVFESFAPPIPGSMLAVTMPMFLKVNPTTDRSRSWCRLTHMFCKHFSVNKYLNLPVQIGVVEGREKLRTMYVKSFLWMYVCIYLWTLQDLKFVFNILKNSFKGGVCKKCFFFCK